MKKQIDFFKIKNILWIINGAVIVAGIIYMLIAGLNFDIKFKGGTIFEYSYANQIDEGKIAEVANTTLGQRAEISLKEDNVNKTADGKPTTTFEVTFSQTMSTEDEVKLTSALVEQYAEGAITLQSTNTVSAEMGSDFLKKCLVAVILTFGLVLLYVAYRFRKIGGFLAGLASIAGLINDILIIFVAFVAFGFSIDDNFMAVILAMLGYALNDTVVVFDRLRENRRMMGPKATPVELMNKSVNDCLSRTIATSVATFFSIAIVCVVALIANLDSIMSFAFPMMIGVVAGCYSTSCCVLPLWALIQEGRAKKGDKLKLQKAK